MPSIGSVVSLPYAAAEGAAFGTVIRAGTSGDDSSGWQSLRIKPTQSGTLAALNRAVGAQTGPAVGLNAGQGTPQGQSQGQGQGQQGSEGAVPGQMAGLSRLQAHHLALLADAGFTTPYSGLNSDFGPGSSSDALANAREQAALAELRRADSAVRQEENAHAANAGAYAGAPQYEYQIGPDGQAYAVAGSVPISTGGAASGSAEEQARVADRIRFAALAPNNPSGQDSIVAQSASGQAASAYNAANAASAANIAQAAPGSGGMAAEGAHSANITNPAANNGPSAAFQPVGSGLMEPFLQAQGHPQSRGSALDLYA